MDPNNDQSIDDRVDIASLSLGGPGTPDDPMSQAIDNIVAAGVVKRIGTRGSHQRGAGRP